jgi:hypothetical protein
VIRRFLRLKAGATPMPGDRRRFSGNRLGELAVARSRLLLRADDIPIELELIRNIPTRPACWAPPTAAGHGC